MEERMRGLKLPPVHLEVDSQQDGELVLVDGDQQHQQARGGEEEHAPEVQVQVQVQVQLQVQVQVPVQVQVLDEPGMDHEPGQEEPAGAGGADKHQQQVGQHAVLEGDVRGRVDGGHGAGGHLEQVQVQV